MDLLVQTLLINLPNMNLSNLFPGGLARCAVKEGVGKLYPIIFDFPLDKAAAIMNPSVFNDNGVIRACVRGTNYTLGHSEKNLFPHWAGPLQYIHPENDVRLATENFIVDFDEDFNVVKVRYCKMLELHQRQWEFHGLEDGRLFRWNDKLFLCGVRRDTTPNGQGRMELSEFILTDDEALEVNRMRIPTPGNGDEYCEKNWMPILDKPYHYIRWANPLELVYYNPEIGETTVEASKLNPDFRQDVRGGSHLVHYKNYYIAMGHTVELWKPYAGEKDSIYHEHLMIYDEDFNLLAMTDDFKFIDAKIEFCCGMALDNHGQLLVSFAEMDNNPFILKLNPDWLISKVMEG